MKRLKPGWVVLISIAIAEGIGFLSGFLSGNQRNVYRDLVQPPFAPPGWLFPVAWGILYTLMGIAAAIIYLNRGNELRRRQGLWLYAVQLLVNFSWSIVFFRFQAFGWAVAVILLLDALVILTTLWFWAVSKAAGKLMIPYLIWLAYASYLAIGVYMLN